MTKLSQLLQDAVRDQDPTNTLDEVVARASRRSTRRRVGAAILGLGLSIVLGGAFFWFLRAADPPSPPSPNTDTAPVPRAADVRCEAGRISLLDPSVRPDSDGVHFVVENRTEELVDFSGWGEVDPGESIEFVRPVAPGFVRVSCYPFSAPEPQPDEEAVVEVRDVYGLWVPPVLECNDSESVASVNPDYFGKTDGAVTGHPPSVLRQLVSGLHEGDVIEPAGYPEAASPVVRVMREGRSIMVASLIQTSNGDWLLGGSTWCTGTGLAFG
ncbi:MAG: hypothetical protein HY658_11155 [Actinobacteria bacterium]|nr:hypothetical protein [Actinomycetota bacterium]